MNLHKPGKKRAKKSTSQLWFEPKKKKERVSPVDSALLFGHYSLEIGELEEAVMEVVQVENTHQQERCGN